MSEESELMEEKRIELPADRPVTLTLIGEDVGHIVRALNELPHRIARRAIDAIMAQVQHQAPQQGNPGPINLAEPAPPGFTHTFTDPGHAVTTAPAEPEAPQA